MPAQPAAHEGFWRPGPTPTVRKETSARPLRLGRLTAAGAYSYDARAGAGSDTFDTIGGSWRAALLGTVAAGAFWCMTPKPVRAGPSACVTVGNVATCTGDQSGGIASGVDFNPAAVDTLVVNSLAADIAPPANTSGIYFSRSGAGNTITIDSNISPHSISVTGTADGIYAAADDNVTVNHTGDITSAGGGGIYALSRYGKTTVTGTGKITALGDGIAAIAYGDVTINHTGDITSNASIGINAYSIYGKVDVTSTGAISAVGPGISAVGYNDVTVKHTGDITSQAAGGVYALSGYGKVTVTTAGNISVLGDGISAIAYGDVSVHHTGNITAQNGDGISAYSRLGAATIVSAGNIKVYGSCGCAADGIHAIGYNGVSISHTGDITSKQGNGIYALAPYGAVSVTTHGNITGYVYGIQAIGYSGNTVTVNGGTVYGVQAGISVQSYPGYSNTITIKSGATVGGGLNAIRDYGPTGPTTVYNYGTVTGNVDLSAGGGTFNNMPGGLFNSGAGVDLGGGTLTNDGTLAPGGIGIVQTTALSGNFVQNADGKFAVDVDLAGSSADKLTVTGTANLAGVVAPRLLSFGTMPQTFTILSAAGGTTDNGLALQNSAVVTYQLAYPNANDVTLTVAGINFAPSGLTPNETAIGQHLQGAFNVGGGALNPLLLYLANLDLGSFASAVDHLSPESYLTETEVSLLGGIDFGNSLFSCPLPANGGQSLMGEGGCYWLRPSGHIADYSPQSGYFGFNEKAGGLTGGAQGELAPNWFLDVGFGYERSTIKVDNNLASATGNVLHGGAALKFIRDNWLVAGSVSGSFARYDTSRYNIPTAGTATAHADNNTLDFKLRFAYAFGDEAFYVKPLVDFDAIGLWRGAIDESGAGPLNLNVQSQNVWLASAAPGLEIGRQWRHGETIWRPYLKADVRFLSKDSLSATASFAGSPAGVAPFTVTTPLDRTVAEVSAGFDVWQSQRFSLRVSYQGRFGAHTAANGGELELHEAF